MLIAALVALAVVFVEIVPVTLVAKLQLFKLTVLVTLVASILTTAAFVRLLPDALRRFGEGVLDRRWTGLAVSLVLLALVAGLAVRDVGRPGALLYPLRHTATPLGEVEAWARAETPTDALFAIPPSVSTFRTFARRAVVANYAGVRVHRCRHAAVVRPADGRRPHRPAADGLRRKAGAGRGLSQPLGRRMARLRSGYGIDYALVERGTRLPFEVAFENAEWTVYRLPEAAP